MTESTSNAVNMASDWASLPLVPGGRSLIEASAGTGKTWTISVLYLRLLLEPAGAELAPLTPRQIVVATFTDAAAQELRARVRARLIWAEQLAVDTIEADTFAVPEAAAPDMAWLFRRWSADGIQARRDLQRLRLALAELDLAPITTLHGLCRRILSDYPFESGSPFGLGEMISGDSVLDELADDLWRRLQQGGADPPNLVSTRTREALRTRLKFCLMPGVGLWAPSADEIERELPVGQADSMEQFAARTDVWALTPTGRQSTTLKNAILALAKWMRDRSSFPSDTNFKHLADRAAQLDPNRRDILLAEPAMQAVDRILRYIGYAMHRPEILAWQEWTQQIREWRDERLAASGRLTFDDLLTRVHTALSNGTRDLADRLFAEWKVALIDEFQDTDAQQYAILDRIYRDAEDAPRGRLVMIGDPKQAIYRFRGGDIDTYLAAKADVESKLELGINFRSSRAYVAAINELFGRAGEVLSSDANHPIRFHPVAASARCDDEPYQAPDDEAARPLVLHYNPTVADSASDRQQLALTACANQIATMLQDGAYRIGDKALEPGDIAVLLPTNPQVLELRELLQQRQVPCVGAGKSSVFDTVWARELQIVLYAVEHAGDEGAVRAALASRLGGLDFAQLSELRDAPDAWQAHAHHFVELKHMWQRDGVLAVVLAFAQDAMTRMPEAAARERALTDLRHLGELLQEQSENVHGAGQLLAWLAEQRAGGGDSGGEAADEQQLRIESDARRVRLMTLHASKGLEFPIVFLPLMWDHRKHGFDKTPVIHEALCGQRVIGFGGEAKAQYDQEGQDERFRVLYVALTRAVHACHVYALPPQRAASARSKEPLQDPDRSALDVLIERLRERMPDLTQLEHLRWIEGEWSWPKTFYRPASIPTDLQLQWLPLPASSVFENSWSFSALTRMQASPLREEDPADDEAVAGVAMEVDVDVSALEANDEPLSRVPNAEILELSMLKGPGFGNALHEVFEERIPGTPLAEQGGLINRALRDAGVRLVDLAPSTAIARIARRLDATLAAELAPGLRLAALQARHQRAEMAFHFVVDAVSIRRLREVTTHHGDADLVPSGIPAATLRGLMTGKIDLVFEHAGRFHVLDYKSNHLGDSLADYAPEALATAMDAHHYRFQALLYTIALDRYLRQRIAGYRRSEHLGDAIYLFVRAVGLARSAGIWRHRFGDALLDAVDAVLGAAARTEAA